MFDFLKSKPKTVKSQTQTDLHSHLIYGVDDGVPTIEDALSLIRDFHNLGYRKIITTPHIMGDYYPNSKDTLYPRRDHIRELLRKENLDVDFHCAAEYYLDEHFLKLIKDQDQLLTFSDNYILIETGFMNKPLQLEACMFDLLAAGYRPVLAHPERYLYFHQNFEEYQKLREKGVLFQLNLNSLTGYYSKPVKKIAEKLIDAGLVDLAGSDCHNKKHFSQTKQAVATKYYRKLMALPLKNDSLY